MDYQEILSGVQYRDNGRDITSTNFYELPKSSEECFMVAHAHIYKVLISKSQFKYKQEIIDSVSAKVFSFSNRSALNFKITITTNTGQERDFNYSLPYSGVYKGTIPHDLTAYNIAFIDIKFYCCDEEGELLLLKTFPEEVTKQLYEVKGTLDDITFEENGEDILTTNYYQLAKTMPFMSFYAGF